MIRGWLFTPEHAQDVNPAIVMIPGFSASSRFPVFDQYAEAFANVGVAALLVDARGFGLSESHTRHEINVWEQARDYRAAIDFLVGTDGIDSNRIGVWGVSMSGGIAAVVAAVDQRVAAAVLQVPAFGDDVAPIEADDHKVSSIRHTVLDADLDSFDRTIDGPLPIVSPSQLGFPSFLDALTAYHWFINYGSRYGTGWENRVTVVRLQTPVAFDAQACVPAIEAPIMMVVADDDEMTGADSDVARQVFDRATAPKELFEISGGHFGAIYHDSPEFTASAAAQQRFLTEHLVGTDERHVGYPNMSDGVNAIDLAFDGATGRNALVQSSRPGAASPGE